MKEVLEEKFVSVPNLHLIAEHGYFIRWGSSSDRQWQIFCDQNNDAHESNRWRDRVQSVMEMYAKRTNGSNVRRKESAVLFRYANTDMEFGLHQASELKDHLESILEGWPLNVVQGKDYIEVRPAGVHKGFAVKKVSSTTLFCVLMRRSLSS